MNTKVWDEVGQAVGTLSFVLLGVARGPSSNNIVVGEVIVAAGTKFVVCVNGYIRIDDLKLKVV